MDAGPQEPAPAPLPPVDSAAAGTALHDFQVPSQPGRMLDPANLPANADGLPAAVPQNMDVSYLKDLWEAIQAQDVNGNDALAALAQQPPR